VKIEEIDQEQKRIALSLAGESADEEAADREGEDVRQYMQKHDRPDAGESLGTLGAILKAKLKEKERK
jgi:hypothetical protein